MRWILTGASVAIAVVCGVGYLHERDARELLGRATERLQGDVVARERTIAARDSLIASFLSPDLQVVTLQAARRAPSGRLFIDREAGYVTLAAFAIAPAPEGRTYQLWGLVDDATPVGIGTFNTNPAGVGQVTLALPSSVRIVGSAITEEPDGGSPRPTSAPFLVTTWP